MPCTVVAEFITPEDYQRVAAPALRVAAELAARRGDPHLCNDIGSMLALRALVTGLARLHAAAVLPLGQTAPAEVYERLPAAVGVMVLAENGIEPPLLGQMSAALDAAWEQLCAAGLLPAPEVLVAPAWEQMLSGAEAGGRAALERAGSQVAQAVDALEAAGRSRH